jgi:hypothetical protein
MDALEARIGLCATCKYCRTVSGARSTFYMCERSFTEPQFARYPPLPVRRCAGHTAVVEDGRGPTSGRRNTVS